MKKVAVVGATGYTGVELLRLLVNHPNVEVNQVTSRANAGSRVDAMFLNFRGFLDLSFTKRLADSDLVFFATPNGVAMKSAQTLVDSGSRVDVMPAGSHPETRSVRGANMCRIAVHQPQQGKRLVVLSVIDNLVKGAAGQAVQNMNIMFGLTENTGLNTSGCCLDHG